ncbi:hypothetical protein AVEN_236491-1 [Araneus ventricosus]|uniref:Uncharacterized protein n=1 Tax=Araneus ventricosus TaxID=182803 RepID=A0A4Y2QA75_ARAVE|nr:hypothetical protein AVEN_236491-1 [Araneus ventricosus]
MRDDAIKLESRETTTQILGNDVGVIHESYYTKRKGTKTIPQNDDRNLKLHQSEKEPSKCPSIFHHKKMKVEESTSCQTVSASSPRGLSSSAIINIAKAAAGESAQNDEPI